MASIINSTTTAGVTVTGDNSGSLQLATNNGTTAVTIDTSQNVGIGTASPTDNLYISRATNAAGGISVVNTNNAQASQIAQLYLQGGDNAYAQIKLQANSVNSSIRGNNDGSLAFLSSTTERMRINSGGALLIGNTATSPATADAYGVTINSNTSGNFYQGIIQASSNGSASLLLNRGSDNGNIALFYRSAVNVGSISVTTSSTAYNTSSDYRLKENIAPMTGALAVVGQLKPCIYTWKADGSSGQGFIAHELAEVVPDCVTGEKDAMETYTDEDGNEQTKPKYQGVDTSFLVATLTAAIQELNAKVEAQAVRIAELEGAR
jgi:hypothetical protein